jgi:hypothetical protein
LGLSDYGEIVGNAITHLRKAGVKIKSIVGDNDGVQVMALAHWSPPRSSKIESLNATVFDFKLASLMSFNDT